MGRCCSVVDDLLCALDPHHVPTFEHVFMSRVTLECKGCPTVYLGMELHWAPQGVLITGSQMIQQLATSYNVSFGASAPQPSSPHSDRIDTPYPDIHAYQGLVGSLLYIAHMWRPDISFSVGILCRRTAAPTGGNWDDAVHLLRYLFCTRSYGITITGLGPIVVYADAGSDDGGRATTGILTLCGASPLSWVSRKQDIITLSMTEAEYVAAAAGAQDAIWVGNLIAETIPFPLLLSLGIGTGPPELRIDSEGACQLASNPIHHRRTKHIDRRHHFIRDRLQRGDIQLSWVTGRDNWADFFTKRLGKVELSRQCTRIGMLHSDGWL